MLVNPETIDKTRISVGILFPDSAMKPSKSAPSTNRKTPPVQTSTWMGFARKDTAPNGTVRIRIRWGRIGIFFLFMGVFLWGAKSAALFYFFRNIREFDEVSVVDMFLFPFNRATVREQQGEYQIDQAIAALEREDYRRAFSLLREGLARAPRHVEGRLLLARIYEGWRPDLATEVLKEGLEDGKENPDYLRYYFGLLLANKEDSTILETTDQLMETELDAASERILQVSRLQSAMYRGRFDIVREIFETTDLENSLDGVLLGTQLYILTGNPETATEILESVLNTAAASEGNLEPIYVQLVRALNERELHDEARETALEMVIRDPLEWRPRLLLVEVLSASGMLERRDREIEDLIQQHRNDEEAMVALARVCGEYGNVQASSRLYEVALENGYNLGLFTLSLIESYVRDGQNEEAIQLCNELVREDPAWLATADSTFNAIRSLAYFRNGNPELGQLYLGNFLGSRQLTPNVMVQAARSFERFGLPAQAQAILERAYQLEPDNQDVLTLLIQVEMQLGVSHSVDEHLRALFELRRPGYDLIGRIHNQLQSDRFLYTENRMGLLRELEAILAEQDQMDWDIWQRVIPQES